MPVTELEQQDWLFTLIIDDASEFGELLKTLFGYNGNPSLSEVIGYMAYLAGVMFLFTRSIKTAHTQA